MCYVVLDLEMCEVPKVNRNLKYKWANETIQIGAVKLDKDYNIVDRFMTYVKPEYGQITGNIKKLTGISQEMVDTAPTMAEAIQNFADWLPKDVEFVAWSENDKMQIDRELAGKGLVFKGKEKFGNEWIDSQQLFSKIVQKEKKFKLEDALIISNIDYDSRIHDGLVDASNTALLFKKMRTEKDYQFINYYIDATSEPETLTYSFGAIFANLKLA